MFKCWNGLFADIVFTCFDDFKCLLVSCFTVYGTYKDLPARAFYNIQVRPSYAFTNIVKAQIPNLLYKGVEPNLKLRLLSSRRT